MKSFYELTVKNAQLSEFLQIIFTSISITRLYVWQSALHVKWGLQTGLICSGVVFFMKCESSLNSRGAVYSSTCDTHKA